MKVAMENGTVQLAACGSRNVQPTLAKNACGFVALIVHKRGLRVALMCANRCHAQEP
jgi:hypothetical protein